MKSYVRHCDNCKVEIKDMYSYGATTLYRDIRVGRGGIFHDYSNALFNRMKVETPNDYDNYGKGWRDDDNKEFNFCCPECLYAFLGKLYKDTYNASIKYIKECKLEDSDRVLQDMEKRKKMNPIKKFFDTSLSEMWIEGALKELQEHEEMIQKRIVELKKMYKKGKDKELGKERTESKTKTGKGVSRR